MKSFFIFVRFIAIALVALQCGSAVFAQEKTDLGGNKGTSRAGLARGVVASDRGSRREFVHDGETGLLYRTGDVNQLAAAIQMLGSWPKFAEKMGRSGWEMVRQRYTPEEHYLKLLSLYEGLVARKAARNHGNIAATDEPRHLPRQTCSAQNPNPMLRQSPGLRVAFIGGARSGLKIQRN